MDEFATNGTNGTSTSKVGNDIGLRVYSQRGLILTALGVCILIGAAYTLFVPPRYEAKAVIILSGAHSSAAVLGASTLGINLGGTGNENNIAMFHRILDSETVNDYVAEKTGYNRKDLRKARTFEDDLKANSIEIDVTDRNKDLALKIDQTYIDYLKVMVAKVLVPSRASKATKLEERMNERERDLTLAEDKLEAFSRSAKTNPSGLASVSPSSYGGGTVPTVSNSFQYQDQLTAMSLQLKKLDALVSASHQKQGQAGRSELPGLPPVDAWDSQVSTLVTKLAELRSRYREDSPEVATVRRQLDEVKQLQKRDIDKYLDAVQSDATGGSYQPDLDRRQLLAQVDALRALAAAAPEESVVYQRLVRNVAILSQLVGQLRLQFENSKLDSEDDPNRWEVLDSPKIADEPVNKNYGKNIGLALLLGTVILIPVVLRKSP